MILHTWRGRAGGRRITLTHDFECTGVVMLFLLSPQVVIEKRLIRILGLLCLTDLPRSYLNRPWQKKSYPCLNKWDITCDDDSNMISQDS
jgi:hypothetical protein